MRRIASSHIECVSTADLPNGGGYGHPEFERIDLTMTTDVGWKFLVRVPGLPTSSGDIPRMFNSGDATPPSSLRDVLDRNDSEAMCALIYGREGVANCFDASRARATGSGSLGLDFIFSHHRGSDAIRMRRALGLDVLADRVGEPEVSRKSLGLGVSDCLTAGGSADLRTLTVVERRGGGMAGALEDDHSVLAQALINVGDAQVSVGAAGSYGYGKAAVAQASRIRSILVYTCFEPVGGSEVTRRLLGVTYWGQHDLPGARYTGWTLFGRDDGQTVTALEDDDADRLAEELGLARRDPSLPDDLGTTFLVIDPGFSAHHLRSALEVAWWPLLQGSRDISLDVTITDEHGDVTVPTVDASHVVLGQFVTAFERAEAARRDGVDIAGERAVALRGRAGVTSLEITDPQSPLNQSLIAQMRSPLMVVSYDVIRNAGQQLVGVFVSHDETNELLRAVEPAEHDKWHRRNVAGLNASREALEVSRSVGDERDSAAMALRPADPPPVYGMSAFSKHFPAIDEKVARPRPPRPRRQVKQRLVRVNLVHDSGNEVHEVERPTRVAGPDGRLTALGEVKFWLDPERARKVGRKVLDATITIGAEIAEDAGGRTEPWQLDATQNVRGEETVFRRVSAPGEYPVKFEGSFLVGVPVFFVATTAPYEPDWTLNLVFDCSPWDVVAPVASQVEGN